MSGRVSGRVSYCFTALTAKTGMEKKNNVPEARSEPGHSIHTVLVTGYATVWGAGEKG